MVKANCFHMTIFMLLPEPHMQHQLDLKLQ